MEQRSSSAEEPAEVAPTEWPAELSRYTEAVANYLASKDKSSPIAKVIGETLVGGGKKLRPVIALLMCEAASGSYEKALPVAAAFELAHSASLVQDDIIDESATRHGQESTHKKYGVIRAILISDAMIFEIFTELAKYGGPNLPQRRLGELISLVGNAAKLTAEGEFYEMTLAEKGAVTEEENLRLAELKTGSLFAAAAACGAVVGGAKRKQIEAAYEFGLSLGISFQIRDDILDISGNEKATGKPVLKDLQNNATNMVLVHALAKASSLQKQSISAMVYKKWFTMNEVQALMSTLGDLGSVRHAVEVERKYALKAKRSLEAFPESGARATLEQLTEELGSRKK